MKILFATSHAYLPQRTGGALISTHELCRDLTARGHSVAVLAATERGGMAWLANRFKAKLANHRCTVDTVNGYPTLRGWMNDATCQEAAARMRPDVVVVVGASPGPYTLAACFERLGLPVIYQMRDCDFEQHGGDLGRLRATFLANSGFVAGRLRERFGIASTVIYPPFRKEGFVVDRPGNKVLMINPDPAKGGEIAIAIAEKRPDVRFRIQECWPSNKNLVYLKERAARSGNVDWCPAIKNVCEIYADARLLLAPSQGEEAWGRVVTEAQLSGIPVLASDIGGLPEAVGPGGRLVDPKADLSVWLQAFSEIWDDPAHWASLSAKAAAHANDPCFSIDYCTEAMLSVCQAAMRIPGKRVG
ncbi:MAG: glycosyltransferase [Betaproteobacteria bacterium]